MKSKEELPTLGPDIERMSQQIIDEELAKRNIPIPEAHLPIVKRVIHATADFSFAETVKIHPDAIARATESLAQKRPLFCDVQMVKAGITRTGCDVHCRVSNPEVIDYAAQNACTRSAAAIELSAQELGGAIIAIGNAPTALWKLIEMAEQGIVDPAVVVGVPVGFVGAAESKHALMESNLCYISCEGPRGGSPVAAAIVNALALISKMKGER